MNYIYIWVLVMSFGCMAEESFVVPSAPKQGATSVLAVKEDFVYCAADLLQLIADLMEQLGRLQKELLTDVMDVVEGTNNGGFVKEKKLSGKQKKVERVRMLMLKIDELNRLLMNAQKINIQHKKN